MESSSSYRRAEAVKQLGRMEELRLSDLPLIVHTKLENALFDPEEEVRREAVMALAFLEGEIALPLLEPLINDQAQSVRSNVISAFSYIQKRPSSGVINLLISYLKDPSEEVRDRCARSLGRMNIEEAINEILRLAKHDPSPVVRAGAVAALGMMKSDDVDNLSSLFQRLFDSETSKMVKETISETLVLITNIPKKD
jgi:HEAT repeat protein